MNKSKQNAQLIIVLFAVLIFVVLYFVVRNPMIAEIEIMESELTTLRPELEILETHNAQLPTYQQKIDDVSLYSAEYLGTFPGGVKEEDMLVWFMNMEDTLDYNFYDIGFSPASMFSQFRGIVATEGTSGFKDITAYKTSATISAFMSYQQVKNALTHTYSDERKSAVDTLSVTYDSTLGELSVGMTVSKYYLEFEGSQYVQTPMPQVSTGVNNLFGTTAPAPVVDDTEDDE